MREKNINSSVMQCYVYWVRWCELIVINGLMFAHPFYRLGTYNLCYAGVGDDTCAIGEE